MLPEPIHTIEPLTIEWGSFETISTVMGLARCLLDLWPAEGQGDAYVTAIMVCDAVLTGSEDDEPANARAAFIEPSMRRGYPSIQTMTSSKHCPVTQSPSIPFTGCRGPFCFFTE